MNGLGKENEDIVPLQDDEGDALRGEIDRSGSIRRSLGQSFISSGKKASFMSSMANIYSTAVGAGFFKYSLTFFSALSLPILVCKFGFVIGVFLIFAVCFIALVSGKLLQRARIICGKSEFYYFLTMLKRMSTLAFHCFRSAGTYAIRLILILFCLGMTISYVIVMCTIIEKIIDAAYEKPKTTFFSKKYFWAVICLIIVSPFAFAKSMERLRFVSYINTAASFVYLIISIIGAARTVKNHETTTLYIGPPANFKFQEALTAFGCIFVAYAYHFNFFPVYKSLENPSDGRMMKVVFTGLAIVAVLYAITACTGYVTFGGIINGDVLSNYQTDTTGIAGYYILLVSYLLLTICGMPMQFFGGRNPLLYTIKDAWDLIQKKRKGNTVENDEQLIENEEPKPKGDPQIPLKFHIICTAIIYVILCIIGITVTNLEIVISILGCVCGNSISYILPGAYVWYLERNSKLYKISAICVFAFGIVSLVLSLAGIIWNEVG